MATYLRTQKQLMQIFTFKKVTEFKEQHSAKSSEYKNLCENLAMLVYNNSLTSAIAQLKQKKDVEYTAMYNHIKEWLEAETILLQHSNDLLETLIHLDANKLRLCTKEVMLLADVLKEIAKAEIAKKVS